jgi:hypothetical protein
MHEDFFQGWLFDDQVFDVFPAKRVQEIFHASRVQEKKVIPFRFRSDDARAIDVSGFCGLRKFDLNFAELLFP